MDLSPRSVKPSRSGGDGKQTAFILYFLTSGHSKHFTILPHFHQFMDTFTHRRWSQLATASSSGAVRVRRLAQGHLDALLGARDRTSNLLNLPTSRPTLPPEPHAARLWCWPLPPLILHVPVLLYASSSKRFNPKPFLCPSIYLLRSASLWIKALC